MLENISHQKYIPSGFREPLKETKNMLEYENDKQVRTITWGPLKKKEMHRDEEEKGTYLWWRCIYKEV